MKITTVKKEDTTVRVEFDEPVDAGGSGISTVYDYTAPGKLKAINIKIARVESDEKTI